MAKIAPDGSETVPANDASEPNNDTNIAPANDAPSDVAPNGGLTVVSGMKHLVENAADLVGGAKHLAENAVGYAGEVLDDSGHDSGHFGWLEDYDSVQK